MILKFFIRTIINNLLYLINNDKLIYFAIYLYFILILKIILHIINSNICSTFIFLYIKYIKIIFC